MFLHGRLLSTSCCLQGMSETLSQILFFTYGFLYVIHIQPSWCDFVYSHFSFLPRSYNYFISSSFIGIKLFVYAKGFQSTMDGWLSVFIQNVALGYWNLEILCRDTNTVLAKFGWYWLGKNIRVLEFGYITWRHSLILFLQSLDVG